MYDIPSLISVNSLKQRLVCMLKFELGIHIVFVEIMHTRGYLDGICIYYMSTIISPSNDRFHAKTHEVKRKHPVISRSEFSRPAGEFKN
jgi:hypothetical protein